MITLPSCSPLLEPAGDSKSSASMRRRLCVTDAIERRHEAGGDGRSAAVSEAISSARAATSSLLL